MLEISDSPPIDNQTFFEDLKGEGHGFDSVFWAKVIKWFYQNPHELTTPQSFYLYVKKLNENVVISKGQRWDGGFVLEISSQNLVNSLDSLKNGRTALKKFLLDEQLWLKSKVIRRGKPPVVRLSLIPTDQKIMELPHRVSGVKRHKH